MSFECLNGANGAIEEEDQALHKTKHSNIRLFKFYVKDIDRDLKS